MRIRKKEARFNIVVEQSPFQKARIAEWVGMGLLNADKGLSGFNWAVEGFLLLPVALIAYQKGDSSPNFEKQNK